MTEKQIKNRPEWLSGLLQLVTDIRGILMVVAALGIGGGTTGLVMAGNGDTASIDSLKVRVDSLEHGFGQMQQNQIEMFSAQIERDTGLKVILQDRAMNRRKATDAREETQKLFKAITGGSQ